MGTYRLKLKTDGITQFAGQETGTVRADLLARARSRYHLVLALDRTIHGRRSRAFANDLNSLAELHRADDRSGVAVVLWRTALSICRRATPILPMPSTISAHCSLNTASWRLPCLCCVRL